MDAGENSWEADVSVFIQYQHEEDSSSWKKAEHATHMLDKYGRRAASKLASEVGVSASYIRSLAQMARIFPETERDPALSISHHRVAAMTESPRVWLDRAAELEMSIRELSRAIREGRDQVSEEEQYQASAERVEQAVRKFNEVWEGRRNVKVVLTWESAGFQVVQEAG